MGLKVANNAYSTLASGISDSATSLSVQAGHGARFPSLGVGDYFYATLIDTSNNIEIIKVTARATDTLTIERGEDGTSANAYVSGDRIEMRWNAAIIDALPTRQMATADIEDEAITYAKVAPAAIATTAEFRAQTASNLLDTNVWDAAEEVVLVDATTIATDYSTFINATVTLGGNRTLGTATNIKPGQSGCIRVVQDGTGSRTLAYHGDYEFAGAVAPVLSTTAGAQDLLFYYAIASGRVFISAQRAIG